MKTIETVVYEFNELSDTAKERAREWYRNAKAGDGYAWADDALSSLKALAEHFKGKLKNWEIDFFNSSYSSAEFQMPEMTAGEIKSRMTDLGSYNKRTGRGNGDCKLTGYCADEDAIDGFRKAWKAGERDLEKLMQSAFDSWLAAAQSDAECQFKDEQVDDSIRANGYTFKESGNRFG